MKRDLVLMAAILAAAAPASAQVMQVAEMNTLQIAALDRAKTVVILPGGILEQHGPYLPSYSDGYANERFARDLAEAIVARPGWTALLFPAIPLGSGGANEIGGKPSFPGTYAVRPSTVRAVYMDLATEIGEQGFRHVFVANGHGSPDHNRALEQAGDFFHDTYGGRMIHLLGLLGFSECCARKTALIGAEGIAEDGFTVHGGAAEHGLILFLRPDLVAPGIRSAAPVTGGDFARLVELGRADGWPGYFGAPARATPALGALRMGDTALIIAFALKVLDGQDPATAPRLSAVMLRDPAIKGVMERSRAHDALVDARQRAWLKAKGLD
jgi:creatinine amidohydrolase/Fe(II)-dependent formamide hydrolase-like protein